MTKVVSVHHFVKQDVIPLEQCMTQKYGICKGPQDIIFVVEEHRINVHDLKHEGKCISSFPTVDFVHQINYCEKGNYVATIEKKTNHGAEGHYARIYLSWEKCSPNHAMKARIAGAVTPNCPQDDLLEMVEFPLADDAVVSCLAICQRNATLALVVNNEITLYELLHKQHHSSIPYKDFQASSKIVLNSTVKEISISGKILAVAFLDKIKLLEINAKTDSSNITTNEYIPPLQTEDQFGKAQNASKQYRKAANYFNVQEHEWAPSVSKDSKTQRKENSLLLFNSLVGESPFVSMENATDSGSEERFKIKIYSGDKSINRSLKIKTIFQFPEESHQSEPSCKNISSLQIVDLIPSSNNLKETYKEPDEGISLFFNCGNIGYLYHITLSQYSEERTILKGGIYHYTSPVRFTALQSYVLHAFTDTGLETYMIRPHPLALRGVFEAPSDIIVSPNWHQTPSLVGLRPFLNVEALCVTQNHLVLCAIDRENDDVSNATLYSLQLPSAMEFYEEMARVASCFKLQSSSMYLHLLLEGHFVLSQVSYSTPLPPEYQLIFESSCASLADYFARCETHLEWKQAARYYASSRLPADAILERVPVDCQGLYTILSLLWLQVDSSSSVYQVISLWEVLNISYPDKIPELLLRSRYVEDCKEELFQYISEHQMQNFSADELLMCLLEEEDTNKIDFKKILPLLEDFEEESLIGILSQNPKKLLNCADEKKGLSVFSQILVKNMWSVFCGVFNRLTWDGTISLDLLTEAFIIHFPIVSCVSECNENTVMLRNFIESVLHSQEYSQQKLSKTGSYTKSISILVSLYIASLLGAFNEKKNTQEASYQYETRYKFLDHLPPFKGKSPAKEKCVAIETPLEACPCIDCNIGLLRLQCLLSSDIPTTADRELVLNFVKEKSDLVGAMSLHCLCLSEDSQQNFMIENFASNLRIYCESIFKKHIDWKPVVLKIVETKNKLQKDDENFKVVEDELSNILDELSVHLTLKELLTMLPQENDLYFRSKIDQCQSHKLYVEMVDQISIMAGDILGPLPYRLLSPEL